MESFSDTPLQTIIPAYVYDQYSDDADIQAFFAAHNKIAQSYLDWFNSTPLAVYTSPGIFGNLLDWIAQGIYGVVRPVISTSTSSFIAGVTAFPVAGIPVAGFEYLQSGQADSASDDIYKRVLTWILYRGDGMQMNTLWLQKRVARFLYGANGTDIPLEYINAVSVGPSPFPFRGGLGMVPSGYTAVGMGITTPGYRKRFIDIAIQNGIASQDFVDLMASGILPVPFQMRFSVTSGMNGLIGSSAIVGLTQIAAVSPTIGNGAVVGLTEVA